MDYKGLSESLHVEYSPPLLALDVLCRALGSVVRRRQSVVVRRARASHDTFKLGG
jgi:hypothetical protein